MFRQATLNLTAWYLAIIMLISLVFSVALYEVATREVTFGLRTPPANLQNEPVSNSIFGQPNFDQLREQRISESQERVQNDLIIFNLVILIAGGALSYLLARKTLEPIEQVHLSQTRFTADASHELRTPLAAMRSEIEVALRGGKLSESETRELLVSNLEEVTRLTVLSESLLKLARYQHHLPNDLIKEIDSQKIVSEAVKNVQKIIELKKIKLDQSIREGKIQADPSMINELITIILDNALKYSAAKSTITIDGQQNNNEYLITIKDQGIGINEKDLPHIFDRFYRADSSRGETKGYGLGLSIASEIVRLHNGKIEINSKIDSGTEVTITLPSVSA